SDSLPNMPVGKCSTFASIPVPTTDCEAIHTYCFPVIYLVLLLLSLSPELPFW
ncbi:hypothetical protein TNCT_511811, partial [Trichonephila clavata]